VIYGNIPMESSNSREVDVTENVENYLRPCINVIYGHSYRVVLRKIVEVFKKNGSGTSFYYLSKKEKVLKSNDMLKRVLNTLMDCGYIVCKEGRTETNSPLGRKDYYPTPLGILMSLYLTLLYPQESDIPDIYKHLITYFLSGYIAEQTFNQLLPHMFHLTVLRTLSQPTKPSSIVKGWLTAEYTFDLIGIKVATKVKWEILLEVFLRIPIVQENLWKKIKNLMDEQSNHFKRVKEQEMKELIEYFGKFFESIGGELPVDVEKSLYKSLDYLYESFELLRRLIEPYGT